MKNEESFSPRNVLEFAHMIAPPKAVSSHSLAFRRMQSGDEVFIHDIHTACLCGPLLEHYSIETIAAWLAGRTPQGYVAAAMGGERFFVAEEGQEVTGFASWQDNELLSLFVSPDRHRKGIGTSLLAACVTDAATQGKRIDFVRATLGSTGFYEKQGFEVSEQAIDTKRGVDLPYLIMRRK